MKMLYYASYALSAPFYAAAWVLYAAAWVNNWIGDTIHDATTYRAWRVLHRRACRKPNHRTTGDGTSDRKECVKQNAESGGSDALFGVSVVKVNGFRSQPRVNTDEDMVRVALDMPKHTWRKLQKRLPPNRGI